MYSTVLAEHVPDSEMDVAILCGNCEGFNQRDIDDFTKTYKAIFSDKPGTSEVSCMEIKLVDGAKIMSQKAHNIPENLRQKVKNEIESLLEAGIIEPSDSAWSSPLVCAQGQW